MSDFVTRAVEIICSQDGVTEHPKGSNRGPEVDMYLRAVKLDPTKGKYAWCAALIDWGIQQATKETGGPGGPPQFRFSASAMKHLELNPGLRLPGPQFPCIFVIDHGSGKGHVGLALSPTEDPEIFRSFEGNTDAGGSRTGGQAMYRTRKLSEVAGWLRIG